MTSPSDVLAPLAPGTLPGGGACVRCERPRYADLYCDGCWSAVWRPDFLRWSVTLSAEQLALADRVGAIRQSHGQAWADRYRERGDAKALEIHYKGARGELAAALKLGLPWEPILGRDTERADVGGYQVRCRSRHDWELTIAPKDADEDIYILVTGGGPTFWLRGWGRVADLKQPEWRRDVGAFRGWYLVPVAALASMDDPPNGAWRAMEHGRLYASSAG